MRRMGRRGLVGMAARTAVVAGTATAVSGAVAHHQQDKANAQAEQHEYELQQEAAAMAPPAAPQAAAPDPIAQLQQLADLKAQGVINDDEFAAAKAKLLA